MSWIISRERAGEYQQLKFTSFWADKCVFGTEGLPFMFSEKKDAEKRMQEEQDKDPDWEYLVNEYLR